MTVSGAIAGNGTYGLSDFSEVAFIVPTQMDYSKELIAQNNCVPTVRAVFGTFDWK